MLRIERAAMETFAPMIPTEIPGEHPSTPKGSIGHAQRSSSQEKVIVCASSGSLGRAVCASESGAIGLWAKRQYFGHDATNTRQIQYGNAPQIPSNPRAIG
jgi:hypothetical protein